MITIVNSGYGNFKSIYNLISKLNISSELTNSYDKLSKSKHIILPGVGSYDKCINSLRELKIDKAIYNALENGSKLLGICVGMQILFNTSEEGSENGLNLIKGKVVKFKLNKLSVPHMGWNIIKNKKNNFIFSNKKYERFYFAHSYHCICQNDEDILAITNYGIDFTSCIHKDNIYGFQFHPEKSHLYGRAALFNFLTKC